VDPKTVIVDALGVSDVLWGAASIVALDRCIGQGVEIAPAILKAAEIYSQSLSYLSPAVAGYRYLRYGTVDSGTFDTIKTTVDLNNSRTAVLQDVHRWTGGANRRV